MVRKIFVDSRFRDHGTNSNFQFTLSAPVLHPKCRAYIDNIHIPNMFYTIQGNNRYIYVMEFFTWMNPVTLNTEPTSRKRKIALNDGQYDIDTMAVELKRALDTGSFFPGAAAGTDAYTVTPDTNTGKLTLSMIGTVGNIATIWTRQYLDANKASWQETVDPAGAWVSQVGSYGESDDCYTVIGFQDFDATNPLSVTVGTSVQGNSHVSVLPFHNLYLTCAYGLGSNEDCIGARGGNILRSIPINAGFGNMIHDQLQNPFDFIQLEAGQLRSFSFALRDMFQREVDLRHGFSFSIVLVEEE